MPVGWYIFPAFYSLAAPSHVLHFRQSYGLDWNRTRNVLTQTSSHNQPRKHDLAFTLTTKTLIILKRHAPPWAIIGPCYLFLGYYSVHPQKRRVFLSQLPHVLWASGCWHYVRTLFTPAPKRDRSFYLSILLITPPLLLGQVQTRFKTQNFQKQVIMLIALQSR